MVSTITNRIRVLVKFKINKVFNNYFNLSIIITFQKSKRAINYI